MNGVTINNLRIVIRRMLFTKMQKQMVRFLVGHGRQTRWLMKFAKKFQVLNILPTLVIQWVN